MQDILNVAAFDLAHTPSGIHDHPAPPTVPVDV
jgi:hypothetical protein